MTIALPQKIILKSAAIISVIVYLRSEIKDFTELTYTFVTF